VPSTSGEAIKLAVDERGQWKGQAVFVSRVEDWTLFDDLTGGLSAVTSTSWLELAVDDDLVFAGYNDAIGYGALLTVSGGAVLLDVLFDESDPAANRCIDRRQSGASSLETWRDVASFVDDDALGFADDGLLWIYGSRG
jgi:hypothetical protein